MILRLGFFLMGLMATVALAAGILFYFTGIFVVDVTDKVSNHRIYAPVPMLLVRGALRVLPVKSKMHVPAKVSEHRELILAAARTLEDCPDGTFVEVESRRDNVSVKKEGRNLYIDVSSPREEVHLQIPIKATGATVADLTMQ